MRDQAMPIWPGEPLSDLALEAEEIPVEDDLCWDTRNFNRRRSMEDEKFRHTASLRKDLSIAAKSGDMKEAKRIFGELEQAGTLIGSTTFSMLMSAAARAGDTLASSIWFNKAIVAGFSPTILEFLHVMEAAADFGDWRLAEAWFRRMHSFDIGVNRIVYKHMMAACINGNNFNRGVAWFRRMAKAGIFPDVDTFNILMSGARQGPDIARARSVLNEMVGSGCLPDKTTFGIMLDVAFQTASVKDALEWFDLMSLFHIQPSQESCQRLVELCQKAGQPQGLQEIAGLQAASSNEPKLSAATDGAHPGEATVEQTAPCAVESDGAHTGEANVEQTTPCAVESVLRQHIMEGGIRPTEATLDVLRQGMRRSSFDSPCRDLGFPAVAATNA